MSANDSSRNNPTTPGRKPSKGEQAYNDYQAFIEKAANHLTTGIAGIQPALQCCKKAWPLMCDVAQFARRKDGFDFDLYPFSKVCEIAPPLFEHNILLDLQEFVLSARVRSNFKDYNLPDIVSDSLSIEEGARKIWNALSKRTRLVHKDIVRISGLSPEHSKMIIAAWVKYGIAKVTPNETITLTTQMDTEHQAICFDCEVFVKAKKHVLCQKKYCPRCNHNGYFLLWPESAG